MHAPLKIVLFFLVLLLSACSYQLQGTYSIPAALKTAYVEGATLPLREHLLKAVRPADGRFAFSPGQAALIIRVIKEHEDSRPLSLNEQGRINERELSYRLDYELSGPDNVLLLPRQYLEIRREFFFSQQDIIATENEEKVIRDEMYQQAATMLISRTRVILEAAPPNAN